LIYKRVWDKRRELEWIGVFQKIGDEVLIDVLEESEGAYAKISLTPALKGVATWTGGLDRSEENGFGFY
jgi:hypothetical protein